VALQMMTQLFGVFANVALDDLLAQTIAIIPIAPIVAQPQCRLAADVGHRHLFQKAQQILPAGLTSEGVVCRVTEACVPYNRILCGTARIRPSTPPPCGFGAARPEHPCRRPTARRPARSSAQCGDDDHAAPVPLRKGRFPLSGEFHTVAA
jgi:hypothetical protein